jgi:hypothetical protein
MIRQFPELSSEAYRVLRQCDLLVAVEFVRCGRHMRIGDALRIAEETGTKLGDSDKEVFWSYHEKFGDYIRVNRGTEAFTLITREIVQRG